MASMSALQAEDTGSIPVTGSNHQQASIKSREEHKADKDRTQRGLTRSRKEIIKMFDIYLRCV